MKIAVLCSNYVNIDRETRKGTEIFVYSFLESLSQIADSENIRITAFASGQSKLPVQIESVSKAPSSSDQELMNNGKQVIFELALLSKAFSEQDQFDLYHVNIGDGDIAIPFSPFVNKPILITIHHIFDADYTRKYFSVFKNQKNIHFISVSNAQRKVLPDLPYLRTIYHGVDTHLFRFDPSGGDSIMWAGRIIPEKGPDIVAEVARRTEKPAALFGIPKTGYEELFESIRTNSSVTIHSGLSRHNLIEKFQKSKVFLSPVRYEESFGLVLIESMACGTPVIAFARGSIPEIIRDGETGFIVNESEKNIRGDWIIKKTGIEGLIEAVKKLYSMPEYQYAEMRQRCREHVEKNFTIDTMTRQYVDAYQALCGKSYE